jgi:hypothetical protein
VYCALRPGDTRHGQLIEVEPMKIVNHTAAIAAVALLLAVTGCTRESPFDTQSDVAKAEAAGAHDAAAAHVGADGEMADGRMMMTDTQNDVTHQSADSASAVALAESDATYKVAIERCESQAGAARTQCKDRADVELAAAKVRAEAAMLAADPNG